jgi:hypothetical protein
MKHSAICLGMLASVLVAVHAQAVSSATAGSADIPRHTAARPGLGIAPGASIAGGGPSDADVGDSDSFGRNVQWLGLADFSVTLANDCTGAAAPYVCQVLAPSASAQTTFDFEDVNRVVLPKNSANSLLCYWLSPWFTVTYSNPTAATVVAKLVVDPTITIENPVLNTPGLIDPTTGAPFNGKLLTGMTSLQRYEIPLPPGITISERKRDSAVCIAGFMSRKTLTETYGLTEAQAKAFFNRSMTVHLNISGSAQYVTSAQLYYGFRIVGD